MEAGRLAALTGEPRRLVLPYWTDGPGNLSLDVDQHTDKLEREAVALMDPAVAVVDGSTVRLRLPLHLAADAGDPVRLRFERKNVGKYPADAVLDGRTVSAPLPLEKLTGMRWAVRIGVPSAARGQAKWTRLPVDVVVDADGNAQVIDRHTPCGQARAEARAEEEARTAASAVAPGCGAAQACPVEPAEEELRTP